jgi:hypothetical protein
MQSGIYLGPEGAEMAIAPDLDASQETTSGRATRNRGGDRQKPTPRPLSAEDEAIHARRAEHRGAAVRGHPETHTAKTRWPPIDDDAGRLELADHLFPLRPHLDPGR